METNADTPPDTRAVRRPARPAPELLDSRQLAALLGVTQGALRTAKSRGFLPPSAKIPGIGVRWRRDDVDRWIEANFKGVR